MTDFIDTNITGGTEASRWYDWNNNIFDDWGCFFFYDSELGKYYFPIISPIDGYDGSLFTQTFNAFGRTFTITHGYPVQGIFKFDIYVNDESSFIFGSYGNVGSGSNTQYENLSQTYSINGINLTLSYLQNLDTTSQINKVYFYFIPYQVSQNSSKAYIESYYSKDLNSIISNPVNNGLTVYFSKTNDVKDWIINDLTII